LKSWFLVCALVAAQASAAEQMDILEIRVLGNTRLGAEAVERAVYPYTGPAKAIEDVESARQSLENAYRAEGFSTVYVDIPEQDVEDGVVRLKVTEGRLANVRIAGARHFSARRIRAALPEAAVDNVPNIPRLQRAIADLNAQTGDRSIVPVLAAGPKPGTVDLTLNVEDDLPARATFEINDQHTADTSPWRAIATIGYDNLFNRLDSISLTYQTAPEAREEVDVLAASYVTRWGREDRNRFMLTLIDSNSDVAAVGTVAVIGKGRIANAQLVFPLVGEAAASHTLRFGASYKDSDEFIFTEPEDFPVDGDHLELFFTPITYLGFTLGESSVWRVPDGEWTLDSSLHFGVRRLVNGSNEFANKRYRGKPNYFYVRADASRRRTFGEWLEARARVGGQYAAEPIIGDEQFALGGAGSIRGYLEAAELGDVGLMGSLELGLQPRRFAGNRMLAETYLFYDTGIAMQLEPLPGEERRSDLASAGIAVNFGFDDHYAASVSWAYPLVPSTRTAAGDSRFLFMMRSSW
jgi:hemolysin activation/secretion protein